LFCCLWLELSCLWQEPSSDPSSRLCSFLWFFGVSTTTTASSEEELSSPLDTMGCGLRLNAIAVDAVAVLKDPKKIQRFLILNFGNNRRD
jgi:hypothetical protein